LQIYEKESDCPLNGLETKKEELREFSLRLSSSQVRILNALSKVLWYGKAENEDNYLFTI